MKLEYIGLLYYVGAALHASLRLLSFNSFYFNDKEFCIPLQLLRSLFLPFACCYLYLDSTPLIGRRNMDNEQTLTGHKGEIIHISWKLRL